MLLSVALGLVAFCIFMIELLHQRSILLSAAAAAAARPVSDMAAVMAAVDSQCC